MLQSELSRQLDSVPIHIMPNPECLSSRKRNLVCLGFAFLFAGLVYAISLAESHLEYFAPVFSMLIFSIFKGISVPEKMQERLWQVD